VVVVVLLVVPMVVDLKEEQHLAARKRMPTMPPHDFLDCNGGLDGSNGRLICLYHTP